MGLFGILGKTIAPNLRAELSETTPIVALDAESWQRLINDRPVEALDEDTGETVSIKPQQDDPKNIEGLLLRFNYVDASGNKTKRVVLCQRCWSANNEIYVRGFCTTAQALRTFRIDRMNNLEDVRTKELIADPFNYFSVKYADLNSDGKTADISSSTPADIEQRQIKWQQQERAFEACLDGLRVLTFMMLADDAYSAEEKDIEGSYIEARLTMAGLEHNPDLIQELILTARSRSVSERSFIRAVNSVAKEEAHFRLLLRIARQLTTVSGKSNKIESVALKRIVEVGKAKGWARSA